jgi:hypothetical protein
VNPEILLGHLVNMRLDEMVESNGVGDGALAGYLSRAGWMTAR